MTIPIDFSWRDRLRSLPVLTAIPPAPLEVGGCPATPHALFLEWLDTAITAGVAEPHAMTLSTLDPRGRPDARVLICKDVDEEGWWFATDTRSAKACQLARTPVAALTFYWPTVGRQVRLCGPVRRASERRSAEDFDARGAHARAVVRAAHALADAGAEWDRDDLARTADELLGAPTEYRGHPLWVASVLDPVEVEFWQTDPGRLHHRVRYDREADGPWQISALPH